MSVQLYSPVTFDKVFLTIWDALYVANSVQIKIDDRLEYVAQRLFNGLVSFGVRNGDKFDFYDISYSNCIEFYDAIRQINLGDISDLFNVLVI
jgi:hypothetical protein